MKRSPEEGSALVLVLIALLIILPLSVILATLSMNWQRASTQFRERTAMEFVAHAAFADAEARLLMGAIELEEGERSEFFMRSLGDEDQAERPLVRVSRETDAVLSLDGRVLDPDEAREVDLTRTGVTPDMRRVRQYMTLAIYLVEVQIKRRSASPDVRLRAVLAQGEYGRVHRLGLKLDRVFRSGPLRQ